MYICPFRMNPASTGTWRTATSTSALLGRPHDKKKQNHPRMTVTCPPFRGHEVRSLLMAQATTRDSCPIPLTHRTRMEGWEGRGRREGGCTLCGGLLVVLQKYERSSRSINCVRRHETPTQAASECRPLKGLNHGIPLYIFSSPA